MQKQKQNKICNTKDIKEELYAANEICQRESLWNAMNTRKYLIFVAAGLLQIACHIPKYAQMCKQMWYIKNAQAKNANHK